MNDRELLALAAKAAGYEVARESDTGRGLLLVGVQHAWNPLSDDGDALRLAVKLQLNVIQRHRFDPTPIAVAAGPSFDVLDASETFYGSDPYAATRRAIVIAAAKIGRSAQ